MIIMKRHIMIILLMWVNQSYLFGQQPSATTSVSAGSISVGTKTKQPDPNPLVSNNSQEKGESFSLMLTDDEAKRISDTMYIDKNVVDDAHICQHLGGIVYLTPTSWTLWFNDQPYSYGSEIPGLTILSISSEGISLKASDSKAKMGTWLKMNQTFCRDSGQALSGDQRR
jgi:hypothetical protein